MNNSIAARLTLLWGSHENGGTSVANLRLDLRSVNEFTPAFFNPNGNPKAFDVACIRVSSDRVRQR